MRIAHLISNYPLPFVGGAEACVHNLASEQARKGHDVKVIAPVGGKLPPLNYEVLPLGPKSVHISKLPLMNKLYFLKALRDYQAKYRFDIWQVTMGYPFGVAAVDFFREYNIPCVLRASGRDIQVDRELKYGARLNRLADLRVKRNYPKFDGFISIVESITTDYLEMGIPREKIHFIPNGVNTGILHAKGAELEIRKSLGIDASKKIILTVGRNDRKKGFQYIPGIIERLCENRYDFIWLLIGNMNYRIKALAEKKGVGGFLMTDEIRAGVRDNEEITFPDKKLADIYKAADIFAFPTLIEGCSTVITEAMASGVPVVTTDAPGVRDMIKDGLTGLISKRRDIAGMADNITRLLDDSQLYNEIKENALAETKDMDWSTIAERYLNAYKEVIRGKQNG